MVPLVRKQSREVVLNRLELSSRTNTSSLPTFRDHRIIEIALNLTKPLRFLPLAPFIGEGVDG